MAWTNIDDEFLIRRKHEKIARIVGNISPGDALLYCVNLWRNSQQNEINVVAFDDVLDLTEIFDNDELCDDFINALCDKRVGLLEPINDKQYRIRGNTRHIENRKARHEKARKAGIASGKVRRNKKTAEDELGVNVSSSKDELNELAVRTCEPNTTQFNSIQSNTTQFNSIQSNTKQTNLESSCRKQVSDEAKKLTARLCELMKENNPTAKIPKNLDQWEGEADKLLRIDKKPFEQAMQVLDWCQKDGFWRANILSTTKFRKKYDQLKLKKDSNRAGPNKTFAQQREENLSRIGAKYGI